ncbi:hypothetical protein IWQ61_003354 [Dispira simplex]|nr:hypothetical protein IWQ61_003354 [Dispira simplex]
MLWKTQQSEAIDLHKLRIPEAPPVRPTTRSLPWGTTHQDPFAYLENVEDPDTVAYLDREATFTNEMEKLTMPLREELLSAMERLNVTGKEAPSKPIRIKDWEFYTRNHKLSLKWGHQDTAYYRIRVVHDPTEEEPSAPVEEKVLDTRLLRWRGYIVGRFVVAPNPDYFAFTVRPKDDTGMETAELWVQRIGDNGTVETVTIIPSILNFVWSGDSKSIYYTVLDERLRSSKVVVRSIAYEQDNHLTGKYPYQKDLVVYEEKNLHWFVDISRSKDDHYVIIHSGSLTSSEVHLIDAQTYYHPGEQPDVVPQPVLIEPRQENVEYFVDHHDGRLFILTNRDSPNQFRMMQTKVDNCGAEHWREWIQLQPHETIEDVDIFKNFIVTYGRRHALPFVQVHCMDQSGRSNDDGTPIDRYEVTLPEKYCMVRPTVNLEYDTELVRFTYNSPFTSDLTVEYDMANRRLCSVDGPQLQNVYGPDYQCIRSYVIGHDGVHIPVTMICRREMEPDAQTPLLLYVYGAYGTSMEVEFRPETLPLLERGWITTLAHVRGGSDLGRQWYVDGKLDHKPNTIRDCLTVAEWLVEHKYTSPSKMAITGTSAGGLVVGAVLNQRPELFRAALLHVPFVDVVSTMLNPDLPLTQVEYLEWGNPSEDPKTYQLMQSYSPYANVPRVNTSPQVAQSDSLTSNSFGWPSIMVTAGMMDQRVMYWQTLKWAAKLRANIFNSSNCMAPCDYLAEGEFDMTKNGGPRNLIVRMEKTSGHFKSSDKNKRSKWEKTAHELAFLVSEIEGLDKHVAR